MSERDQLQAGPAAPTASGPVPGSVAAPAPQPGSTAAAAGQVAPAVGPGIVALRVVGGFVAVVLLAAGARSVAGEFLHRSVSSTSSYPASVRTVVADSDVGSVTVRAGAPGTAPVVRRTSDWSFGRPPGSSRVEGTTLYLEGRCSDGDFVGGRCSVDFDVTVAPETVLDLRTSTGSVRAEGMAGDVRVSTSTGRVDLRRLSSRTVSATGSTGPLRLEFLVAPTAVTARTSTGSIDVSVPADSTAYAVDASTSVGTTTVTVPVDRAAPDRIEATSSVGDVTVRPVTARG